MSLPIFIMSLEGQGIFVDAKGKWKRAVFKIDPKTDGYLEVYLSAREAARKNNTWDSHIAKVCKGIRPLAGGFKWAYVVDIKEK